MPLMNLWENVRTDAPEARVDRILIELIQIHMHIYDMRILFRVAYQPRAVPRSVGLYMSPMTLDPITRKAVPWKAVKILKMKKAARFGARAVPTEKTKNNAALTTET